MILIVGEFPTLNEAQRPFTNGLWRYFKLQLSRAGIAPADCHYLNVINRPGSSLFSYTQREKAGSTTLIAAPAKTAYIRSEFSPDIETLYKHINRINPNIIIACGDLPLVTLTGQTKLKFARGRVTFGCEAIGRRKVLPVWHPRAVMADISQEPILQADLRKANKEARFPDIRRPKRILYLRPSLADLEAFWSDHLASASIYSVDIETAGAQITCVGIAPSDSLALVIPFYDEEKPDGNYWPTPDEERQAWDFIQRCFLNMNARTLGQNFSYDAQYFLRRLGITIPNWSDDTMLLHHALQPEMEKGLGFLASIYTDELSWKFMHKRRSDDRTGKKGDE